MGGGQNPTSIRDQMQSNGGTCNLEEVSSEKDLGVKFDNLLAFDAQCDSMVKKANKVLCTIRRSFHYLDEEVMLQLYKAMVIRICSTMVVAMVPDRHKQSSFWGTPGLLPVTSRHSKPISAGFNIHCGMRFLMMQVKRCNLFKFQKQTNLSEI